MRYKGGKRRSQRQIAERLRKLAQALGTACIGDMFAGSCSIEQLMLELGTPVTVINDGAPAVVSTLRAVRDGTWEPPAVLSVDRYREIKEWVRRKPELLTSDPHPLVAFALAFCSYGGKWSAGLMPEDKRWSGERTGGTSRHAAAKATRDLLALRPALRRARLTCAHWRHALGQLEDGSVAWLDAPWIGDEAGYPQAEAMHGKFDHRAYRREVRVEARRVCVLVSEANMPEDEGWRVVWESRVREPGLQVGKVERLWMHRRGLGADVLLGG